MQRVNFLISAIVAVIILSALPVYSQTPAMPDYSKWQQVASQLFPAIHNGNQVNLKLDLYTNMDVPNLKRHTMILVYNEKNNSWLAILTEEIGEKKPDGSVKTKETHHYLFENQNNKWVLGKIFQDGTKVDQEIVDLFKSKYSLEFK